MDTLIRNGLVIDGTGAEAFRADVGITDGKIALFPGGAGAEVLREIAPQGTGADGDRTPQGIGAAAGTDAAGSGSDTKGNRGPRVIDAAGKFVCPGFIDAHSHGDLIIGSESAHLFKTTQGVTTECMGQCGLSMVPAVPENLAASQNILTMGTTYFPEDMKNWSRYDKFLDYVKTQKLSANGKMYIGHSNLRIAVMGMANRPTTACELDIMKGILREAMEDGCAGFSTGLIYTPSCYARPEEIVELAKVIAPFDGIYASHMRNEGKEIVAAVKETIDVGRKAGVRVDLSHHKMVGRSYWGKYKETLALVHEANDEGIPVFLDQYPYERCMTTLNVCMPPWHFADGFSSMTGKLRDPAFRRQVKAEMTDPATPYDNYFLHCGGFDGIFVYLAAKTPEAEGRTLSEYAELLRKDPFEAFFDLCVANNCETGGVYAAMSDEDVCAIIKDPYCIVGSDGLTRSWDEKGHPRASGTFPHAITHFVKEKKLFTKEEMIRKMTGLSADLLRIRDRGYLRDGYAADLLVLDYENLRDTATYTNPNSMTEGIEHVFVNGQEVYAGKKFTGKWPGKILKH